MLPHAQTGTTLRVASRPEVSGPEAELPVLPPLHPPLPPPGTCLGSTTFPCAQHFVSAFLPSPSPSRDMFGLNDLPLRSALLTNGDLKERAAYRSYLGARTVAGERRAEAAGLSRSGGGAGTAAVAAELAETTSLIAFLNVQVRGETGVWGGTGVVRMCLRKQADAFLDVDWAAHAILP